MSTVTQLEPWVSLADLAKHCGCSVRFLKYRVSEGMPSAIVCGKRKVQMRTAIDWLERENHIVRSH